MCSLSEKTYYTRLLMQSRPIKLEVIHANSMCVYPHFLYSLVSLIIPNYKD